MPIRTHEQDGLYSEAEYSGCGAYRYRLARRWNEKNGLVNFIMLNPSVADEFKNDPTVERCERRARRLGFGAFSVTNIFAWRDTDPFKMRKATHPIGPENDHFLTREARNSDQVIVAWGVHGAHMDRGWQVVQMLRDKDVAFFHLGRTKDGHPKHPLYLPYSQEPRSWYSVKD